MELSKFQAIAKKRNGWAAIDLGCVMARAWFFKLWLVWLVPVTIISLIATFILSSSPGWAFFIVWWLKPIWERPLLFIASRQLFGEHVSFSDVSRHYISCNKKDWLWWLSLRRLHPSRGFLMPVTVLEGLKGKVRGPRVDLLNRRFSGPATMLTFCGLAIEVFLWAAIITGIYLLIPTGVDIELQTLFFEQSTLTDHASNFIWLIAASVISPFYVCASFALYLQRRIDLEGWDIEIQFRQLSQRLKKKNARRLSSLSVFLAFTLVMTSSWPTAPVHAQQEGLELYDDIETLELNTEADIASLSDDAERSVDEGHTTSTSVRDPIKKQVRAILSEPPFLNEKTEKTLSFKEKSENDGVPEWLINFFDWLGDKGGFFSKLGEFFKFLAKSIEFVLWTAVILLIVFVLWHRRKWIAQGLTYFKAPEESDEPVVPKTLFGIDLEDEPLPDDVLTEVRSIWRDGKPREAFSLLLRAVILHCVDKGCRFKDGYTENECAHIVRESLGKSLGSDFSNIVGHWQQLAYAHRLCNDEQFESLCLIFARWEAGE